MLFNSFEFAVFFVVVYSLYLISSHRLQNRILLVASYFFYGWWNWKFLSLIVFSTLLDYYCGLGMASQPNNHRRRRALLVCSLVGNLGVLGFFKYFNFFSASLTSLLESLGLHAPHYAIEVVLPVGISFYTFQTLSYTIDIYRGQLKPTRNFLDFALFVSFFPQLVAGPIERASSLLPQMLTPRRLTRQRIHDGSWLMYWGLFKKMFIADNLARFVDPVYSAPQDYSALSIILATYAFAGQIYCDFSGYSDIARGLGKLMGFEIRLNFDLPYFAKNPSDLWHRWHISLSSWIRDYLYIPLGGSRRGVRRVYFNLFLSMTLAGLWHGARWNFVLWGMFHGGILMLYRALGGTRRKGEEAVHEQKWINAVRILFMFHLTCLGWILFRIETSADIPLVFHKLLTDWTFEPEMLRTAGWILFYSAILIAMQFYQYFQRDLMAQWRLPAWARVVLYVILYLCLSLGGVYEARQFIYFQF